MTDLIKGVLGGGWALIFGWIFPAGLSVGLFVLLVRPSIDNLEPLVSLEATSAGTQSLIIIGAAIVLGVLLNAVQTPLYRILEGYLFWPKWLAARRRQRHIERQAELDATAHTATGYKAGLALGRLQRYPDEPERIVPTGLGNAIRRFEVYGWTRYRLNTQTLWYRIVAVVPDSAAKAADNARAGVDFFVCLLYGQLLVSVAAAAALASDRPGTTRLYVALGVGVVVALLSYRFAIVATDEWNASVRALADLARVPLAKALGLRLPPTLEDERQMWRAVYLLERDGYNESTSHILNVYRDAQQPGLGDPIKPASRQAASARDKSLARLRRYFSASSDFKGS